MWDNGLDIENYYSKENKNKSDLVEKDKPMFEQIPETSDYKIGIFEVGLFDSTSNVNKIRKVI